jgi:GntR family transcriptional regulator
VESSVIELRIDQASGVPPYRQIVNQVRQAMQLGILREGDQLPTVKEVVAQVAINPNTVLKAYRELEHEGMAAGRPGVGTFITRTLSTETIGAHRSLRAELDRWVRRARAAGLDGDAISALVDAALRTAEGAA